MDTRRNTSNTSKCISICCTLQKTQIWVRRLLETAFPAELKMYSRVQDFPSHPTTFLCAKLKERWIRVSNTVFPKQLIFIADDNIRDIFRLFYSSPILFAKSLKHTMWRPPCRPFFIQFFPSVAVFLLCSTHI